MKHAGREPQIDTFGPPGRDYYDMADHPRQEGVLETTPEDLRYDGLSPVPAHKIEQSEEATASKPPSRRGYWDIMSIFRSTNNGSTTRSKTDQTLNPDHP